MAIIGIDLGTTNSLACIFRNGRTELIPNELGTYKTSSVVSLLEDGTVLVGAAAKERLISNPQSTAASFKVWMGTERLIPLGGRSFCQRSFLRWCCARSCRMHNGIWESLWRRQ